MNTFGKIFKTYILQNDIKQKEVAKLIGISENGLSNALKRDNVGLQQMERIANALDCDLKIELIPNTKTKSNKTTQSENQISQDSDQNFENELSENSNSTIGNALKDCLSNIKEKLSCVISTNKNFSNIKKDLSDIVSAYKNPKQIKKPSVLCKDQRGLINYACSVLCFTLIHAFLLHFGCYSIALAVPIMTNTLSGLYHFSRSKRFKNIIWDILLILPHFIFGTILIVSQNESAILIAKIFEYLVTDLFVLYNALDDDMSKS